MSIQLSWDSLWALFERSSTEEKIEIYRQLEMEHFICGLDAKHQVEVLKNAPKAVLQVVDNKLYLETKITLGLTQKAKPDFSNYLVRIVME